MVASSAIFSCNEMKKKRVDNLPGGLPNNAVLSSILFMALSTSVYYVLVVRRSYYNITFVFFFLSHNGMILIMNLGIGVHSTLSSRGVLGTLLCQIMVVPK